MNTKQLLTTGLLLGGMAVVGCKSEEPVKPSTAMTQPAAMGKPTKPEATTKPVMPAKEMTHVLTSDTPFSATYAGPVGGTLAKGTKVLVVAPGSTPEVETADGKTVFLKAANYESVMPPPPPKPIAKPVAPPPAVTVKPAEAASAKEMTHVLSKDQPYMAAPGGPAAGTLKAGTKVLLLIPGSTAQVETADGMTVYTSNDGVDLIPAPKKK